MVQCPHCHKAIPLALFAAHLGSLSKGKTSERKKKSSRENGKLGGRPKQKSPVTGTGTKGKQ